MTSGRVRRPALPEREGAVLREALALRIVRAEATRDWRTAVDLMRLPRRGLTARLRRLLEASVRGT